jgi:hypothetical protein
VNPNFPSPREARRSRVRLGASCDLFETGGRGKRFDLKRRIARAMKPKSVFEIIPGAFWNEAGKISRNAYK